MDFIFVNQRTNLIIFLSESILIYMTEKYSSFTLLIIKLLFLIHQTQYIFGELILWEIESWGQKYYISLI